MVDRIGPFYPGPRTFRLNEIRRGEYAPGVNVENTSIPGGGLFFSTDNEMMSAPRTNVMRAEATGTFDVNFWTTAVVGSGTAVHATGELSVGTGVTANSTARVTSTTTGRQMSGTTQFYITALRLGDFGAAGNIRRWGLYDDNDGFFFELNGTAFSVVTRRGGVDTAVPYSSCNGPATENFNPATDLTKINQYNIFFGGLSCRFQVNGRVLHSIGANTISAPLTNVLTLPFRYESNNSGGLAADYRIFGRGVSFHRISPNQVTPRFKQIAGAATTVVKSGAGTLRRLVFNNTTAGTVTIYDNTAASGTVIAIITPVASGQPFTLDYDLEFGTGLTIVTSAAGMNLTATFD